MPSCWKAVLIDFSVLFLMSVTPALASPKQVVNLNSGWRFRVLATENQELTREWLPATVPGVVQTDLLANKLIPDPFYRDNESRLQWIGLSDWEYGTSFEASAALLGRAHVELVFAGLDTYAEVFLNDQPVLTADNMFREWRVDIKSYLKSGQNSLRVVFHSPITYVLKQIENAPYHLATVQQVAQVAEKGIATDPYTRKAPYNYGWDWGPRYITIGIWKPVTLEAWDAVTIRDLHIQQNEITSSLANLSAIVEVEATVDGSATVIITGRSGTHAAVRVARNVKVVRGQNRIVVPLEITNPALWYPNGYGLQSLYQFKASLVQDGTSVDQVAVRTGLRSLQLRREPDPTGASFEFVVNGIPVFGKGADVIPFDSFPNRVTPEIYRHILESARDAHMNMIRSWGGGYYESEEFYNLCDELGLMVWQDFMFGGAMVPGGAAFQDNVRQEAIYQVKRLRNHPSLVIWCGNNEVEAAWYFWKDRKVWKESLPPAVRERVWQDYLVLFSGILPTVVAEYGGGTPYWPSSPSANYQDLPGSQNYGDMHYWEVWHALAPLEEYRDQHPRFMTEYGFQSFPELRTILAFAKPEDLDISSPVMLAHQKNVGGNARIRDYMLRYYREPKDFGSFLYVSQVLQAEAIRIGAEHLRRQRPRTMGSLYWQLNDCWPVASWSSIDYYGRWKALHYYARRFYKDLLVSALEEKGSVNFYVVSDRTSVIPAKLRARLLDFSGRSLWEKDLDVRVAPLSSAVKLEVPRDELLKGANADQIVLLVDLAVDGKVVSQNTYFFDSMKNINLPATRVEASLSGTAGKYKLRVTSSVLAKDVYVSFGNFDVVLSDNYFDLLPGEAREIEVTSQSSLAELQSAIEAVSLADAFVPAAK